jgi:hypothetical protein
LARDIQQLVETLGGTCTVKRTVKPGNRPVYKLAVHHAQSAQFFSLPRKQQACTAKKKPVKRTFRSITVSRTASAQCIQIADPRGVYLTNHAIATHNTHGCIVWLLEQAFQGKPGQHCWWVAPWYQATKIAYRRAKRALPPQLFKAHDTELTITLANEVTIWFKSGEKPDALYGEDVVAAVIDEASRLREEAFHAVRSTLTATRGKIRMIGNVKGRKNWFWKLCRLAQAGQPDHTYSKLTYQDAVAGKIMDPREAEAYRAEKQAESEAAFTPTQDGWTESPWLKFKELAGGSLPYMAAPLAAGAAAATLPVAAPAALLAGAGAGHAAIKRLDQAPLACAMTGYEDLEAGPGRLIHRQMGRLSQHDWRQQQRQSSAPDMVEIGDQAARRCEHCARELAKAIKRRNAMDRFQPRLAAVLTRQHHGVFDLLLRVQHRLDFAQFDAKTANLDLMIDAAEELDVPVGQVAGQVPSPVQRPSLSERVG